MRYLCIASANEFSPMSEQLKVFLPLRERAFFFKGYMQVEIILHQFHSLLHHFLMQEISYAIGLNRSFHFHDYRTLLLLLIYKRKMRCRCVRKDISCKRTSLLKLRKHFLPIAHLLQSIPEFAPRTRQEQSTLGKRIHLYRKIDSLLNLENDVHTILLYEEGYLTIVVEASLCAITDEEHTNLF